MFECMHMVTMASPVSNQVYHRHAMYTTDHFRSSHEVGSLLKDLDKAAGGPSDLSAQCRICVIHTFTDVSGRCLDDSSIDLAVLQHKSVRHTDIVDDIQQHIQQLSLSS